MIISKLHDNNRFVVVGGGLAGLLSAYQVSKNPKNEVTLFEKTEHLGGLLKTKHTGFGIAESAAHSILATPPVEKLFYELNVPYIGLSPGSHSRYIFRKGKMKKFPLNIFESLGLVTKVMTGTQKSQAFNLQEWSKIHLGQAALDFLISPFLLGIYGAQARDLDPRLVFPQINPPLNRTLLKHLLSQGRSRARPKMMTPLNGLSDFVDRLVLKVESRKNVHINRQTSIANLTDPGTNNIVTVPAYEASHLLRSVPGVSEQLEKISYLGLITATVFIKKKNIKRIPQGVGVLVPPQEDRHILGVLFNSSSFANRVNDPDFVSLTVMLGGTIHPELLSLSESALRSLISDELDAQFGLKGTPEHFEILKISKALPLYSTQTYLALESLKKILSSQRGLILFGNYSGKISLRGMIEDAEVLSTFN